MWGGVLARVFVWVHTLLHTDMHAEGQQRRDGLLVEEVNLPCANSSSSALCSEEIVLLYQTNKPGLLASALREMVITQIFG